MMDNATAFNDGQLDISCNVAISVVNGDTGERDTQYYHNRVTRTALMGIVHFIYGDFDVDSSITHKKISGYTPKYLALGGIPIDAPPEMNYEPSIGVDIKKLDHEFANEKRILISNRQMTNTNQDYITISFRTYVPSEIYQNVKIFEAGLFIGEEGDNCWSKIAVTRPISKGIHDYVDVLWEVKVRSIKATNDVENVENATISFNMNAGEPGVCPIDETQLAEALEWLDLPEGITPQFGIADTTHDGIQPFPNTLADYGLSVDVQADAITISGNPDMATTPTVTCFYQYETLHSNKILYITLNGAIAEQGGNN